jgi:hypothetical protein
MQLSAREIQIVLEALRTKYGPGYAADKEVGQLQAKLSIMLEVRVRMGDPN